MKPKIILAIVSLLMCSCERNSYSRENIETITNEISTKRFSSYEFIYVFVPVDNNSIGMTKLSNIEFVYNNYFSNKYRDLSTFLYQSFNQNVKLSPEHFDRSGFVFKLNSKFFKECQNLGVKFILNKYSTALGGSYCINRVGSNDDKLYAILYYLFLNKYLITNDDYSGFYHVELLD